MVPSATPPAGMAAVAFRLPQARHAPVGVRRAVEVPVLQAAAVCGSAVDGSKGAVAAAVPVVAPWEAVREPGGQCDSGSAAVEAALASTGLIAEERENAITKFFREAPPRSPEAAALPRVDVSLYYEKKRVQTGLRRLLEALQERFSLDVDCQASDLAVAFDALMTTRAASSGRPSAVPVGSARSLSASARARNEAIGLTEEQLGHAIEEIGAWPDELSPKDRSEVVSAIQVPSLAAVRAVLEGQRTPRPTVSCRAFCDGLDRVPFNLPVFPVPEHVLLKAKRQGSEVLSMEKLEPVAQAVAATFSAERTGVDHVRDFFDCGLISVEEIQRALPQLVPCMLVEDAVSLIIRRAAPRFSPEEWEQLVVTLRKTAASPTAAGGGQALDGGEQASAALPALGSPGTPPPAARSPDGAGRRPASQDAGHHHHGQLAGPPQPLSPLDENDCVVSLSSPKCEARDVAEGAHLAAGGYGLADGEGGVGQDGVEGALLLEHGDRPAGRGHPQAVTEPLPCRELRSEEPVRFIFSLDSTQHGSAVAPPIPMTGFSRRVVDWQAPAPGSSVGGAHKADEGAGSRATWGTSGFKRELAEKMAAVAPSGAEEDYLAWIDLSLHTECNGPYLARAFVLSCQLYERQGQRADERP